MSLVQDIAEYIAANSVLVTDTDLFVGGETVNTPSGSVVVREFAGSTRNESGLEARAIQLLASDLGYINAETLLNEAFNLFANMPGFATEEFSGSILFVNVLSMPGFVDRDKKGNYVFSSNLLFNRKSDLDEFIEGEGGGIPVGYPVLNELVDDVAELQDALEDDDYMRKEDYDTDDDKIVDEAESIDGGAF